MQARSGVRVDAGTRKLHVSPDRAQQRTARNLHGICDSAPSSGTFAFARAHEPIHLESIMFNHILVPTDFGETAEHALDVAIELAKKFGSRISLLHVYQIFVPAAYGESIVWPADQIASGARQALDTRLSAAKQRYAGVEAILKAGNPADEIIEVAKSSKADAIVMGTHGRRGVSRLVMGSVAERVVRTSPVPVLTLSGKAP
jgi:nucleotide-binding universal stress UspA family protein